MIRARRHRSLVAAILISVVVHVCALLWTRETPTPVAPSEPIATVELNFIDVVSEPVVPLVVDPPAKEKPKKVVEKKDALKRDEPTPQVVTKVTPETDTTESDPSSNEFAERPPVEDASREAKNSENGADDSLDTKGSARDLSAETTIDFAQRDRSAETTDDAAKRELSEQSTSDVAKRELSKDSTSESAKRDRLAALTPTELPKDFVLPDPEPISRGRTIRNDPSELPDALTLRIIEEERVRGRVDTHVNDTMAVAKVESGGGSVYATELREVLRKAAEKPPPFDNHNSAVARLVDQYKDGAARFGQTGSPYDVAASPYDSRSQSVAGKDTDPVRTRSATDAAAYHGLNQEMQKGAGLRAFADGKLSKGIVAVVELVQDPTAKLVSVQLIQASGSPMFDKFVLELAPKSIDSMKPFAPGSHPRGLRTWWEFRGVITYTRSTKTMNLRDDGWYLAAMLPAGMLAGSFEETTGEVYVIDIRNPQYKCKVKLLRVYE